MREIGKSISCAKHVAPRVYNFCEHPCLFMICHFIELLVATIPVVFPFLTEQAGCYQSGVFVAGVVPVLVLFVNQAGCY